MDLPGIKLLCRPSYEFAAAAVGSPFDYPLSSRFDENDAVLMFDDVEIPWENFLIYRNLEIASTYHLTGFIWRAMLQSCTRLAVKLDFIIGAFIKALESTGTIAFRGIQASIGELLAWRHAFWALSDAMVHEPVPSANGSVLPNIAAASAYRILSNIAMPQIKTIIENQVAGALIVQPSHAWTGRTRSCARCSTSSTAAPTAMTPRQDQGHQAALGRRGQRVRRPPRAVRAHLLGQRGAGAAGVLRHGQGRRHRGRA